MAAAAAKMEATNAISIVDAVEPAVEDEKPEGAAVEEEEEEEEDEGTTTLPLEATPVEATTAPVDEAARPPCTNCICEVPAVP